jgi:hypothetical protein
MFSFQQEALKKWSSVTDIRPGKKAGTPSGGYAIKTKQNWH